MTEALADLPTYVRADQFTAPLISSFITSTEPSPRVCINGNVLSGGSREHYFHFLLGYLLPLIHEQENNKFEAFKVLECGPVMTPILKDTLERCGYTFTIIPRDQITSPHLIEKWDYAWADEAKAERVIQRVIHAWSNHRCHCGQASTVETLLIARSQPIDYYRSDLAEIKGYGSSRREITNWPEVSEYLTERGIAHRLYEPGSHTLGCQINRFKSARTIVGVRGAEWANIVWCTPGVKAMIFDPAPPATTLTSLLQRKHVAFEFKAIGSTNAPADPADVFHFLQPHYHAANLLP